MTASSAGLTSREQPQAVVLPYQCRLPGFEGPLDVLLRLIERHELDITAISLATVADDFVAHLAATPDRDPALLAEFVALASRLILLKTRTLFPRPPEGPAGDPGDDGADEDELVRQLQEYRRIKEAAGALAARDRLGERAFAPPATADATQGIAPEITLAPARAADLIGAVQRRLARVPAAPRVLTLAPRISVGEMVARIIARLRARPRGGVRFSRLAAAADSRAEVATIFMALLELVRRRRAEVAQEVPFGDIVVTLAAAAPAEPANQAADD